MNYSPDSNFYLTPFRVIEETRIWEQNRDLGTHTASTIMHRLPLTPLALAIIYPNTSLAYLFCLFFSPPVKGKLHKNKYF